MGLQESEIDSIGEIISNLYGALESREVCQEWASRKDAMNDFMKRVQGSIDKTN